LEGCVVAWWKTYEVDLDDEEEEGPLVDLSE
jgi:hypothetical protein